MEIIRDTNILGTRNVKYLYKIKFAQYYLSQLPFNEPPNLATELREQI